MQLLYLFIFIGAAQCDDSPKDKTVAPESYNHLGIPNAVEYISQYTISVQTSFVTSTECMISSNNYIQSGFSDIDKSTNDIATNLITTFKDGYGKIGNMIYGLQQTEEEKESQKKIDAVVSMTANYYKKKDVTVKKSETKLSEVTEVKQAQSILTARRCESSYANFMTEVTTMKSKYASEQINTKNINSNQWATLVKQYYDARETLVNKTNVYASIREAFLFGSGIHLCDASGSANVDQSLLEIYKTNDLSKYFGKTDNNSSALLSQTVTQMYTIYKASLTNIYLKSVAHSKCDLAARVAMWEQVNLVRANFEYMSLNIVTFITTTQKDAESKYGVDSEDYKKITTSLYTSVNKMLLTVVKSTEVHYRRALNFNADRNIIKTDFNQYKKDVIDKFNENVMWSNTNAVQYDMRLVEKEQSSYPSSEICIPQGMYSLVVNKLVFQTLICQVNYINTRIKTTNYDSKTVESWIYDKIQIIEFQFSIIFSKHTVIVNKMFIINSATYAYVALTTEQNTQSDEVKQIIDQNALDTIGVLSVNTLEITETYNTVNTFIDKNSNTNATSIVYKPSTSKAGSPSIGGNSTSSPSTGSYPTGSPPAGGPPAGGPPAVYSPAGGPPAGGPPAVYSPAGGPPAGDPSTGGYPADSPSTGGPPAVYSPAGSPPAGDPSTGGYPADSPSTGGPPAVYSPAGSPPAGDPSTGGYPADSPSTGGPPAVYSPAGSPPAGDPSTGGYPADSPSTGGPPAVYSPAGSPPAGDPSTGGYPADSPSTGGPPAVYSPAGAPSAEGPPASLGSSTNGDEYNVDFEYSYIKSGSQITKTVDLLQSSFNNKITSSLNLVKTTQETEYTKVVTKSLEICQKISQYNTEYLNFVASDSIKYICETITPNSQEYFIALIALFSDTQEKSNLLSSSMDIPFKRTSIYPLTLNEYTYISQTIEYTEFVKNFYLYFEVDSSEIYNTQNDAELFLKNSITQFNKIYETVKTAVQQTPDNPYKTFLISYLEKTISAYKQTTDSFSELIVQTQQFITQTGENSKYAFCQEIVQRLDSINVMYSSVLIKSYEYTKNPTSVTIFQSEYDIITTQTQIVSTYTTTTTTSITTYEENTVEIEVSNSNQENN